MAADGGRSVIRERIVGDAAAAGHRAHVLPRGARRSTRCRRICAGRRRRCGPGHNTHIVHYPLRGWKLFNLVATVIGKHTSGGHNELAMPDEVLPLFAHYCEKPTQADAHAEGIPALDAAAIASRCDNWMQGRVALLGDAAHFMLQYMAQGAAMAMEDAVCLGACADAADGNFEKAFQEYQKRRLVRATRVQISANELVGMIFHVPDGLEREVRNDIYRGRSRRALLRRARMVLHRAGLRAQVFARECDNLSHHSNGCPASRVELPRV